MFSRGYGEFRNKIRKTAFLRNCFNCKYYYKERSDSDEFCQNDKVNSFDINILSNGEVVCPYWELVEHKTKVKSIFKKGRK